MVQTSKTIPFSKSFFCCTSLNVRKCISFITCTFLLGFQTLYAQTEQQLGAMAKSLEINSRQAALMELSKRGITENQARQMARMRGIDFDSFLTNYLGTSQPETSLPLATVVDPTTSISEISVGTSTLASELVKQPSIIAITPEESRSNYFGYSIFQTNPFLSKDYLTGNIDEGYLIAPGDRLRLLIFGNNSLEAEVEVDLNGNISIPGYGVFQVGGNTFKTLRERLRGYFGKYFQDLMGSNPSTFLDVSLTQIRPVQITVVGESNAPGAHLVSGMASVLNALYASGGIKTSGSLRRIRVYRNNKLVKEVDLYGYLTTGKLEEDFRLTSGDILFIPPRVSSVSLTGEIKNPKIYELLPHEGLDELVKFSGGLLPTTSTNSVVISRIKPGVERTANEIYDRYLSTVDYQAILSAKQAFLLQDGDEVRFFPILNKLSNGVVLKGNVNQPGEFSISDFPDLKSLILTAGKNVRPNTYMGKVDVFKEDFQGKKSFVTYNLNTVLTGNQKISLSPQDEVRIYSLDEIRGEQIVRISGFLEEPKTLFWRENLSVFDLIFQSTSFEELEFQRKLLTSRVDLKRLNVESGKFEILSFSLDRLEEIKSAYLLPKDEVILYSRNVTDILDPKVRVAGYVNSPGVFSLTQAMRVEDALLQAGGFKEYADQDLVIVNRERFDYNSGQLSERFELTLDKDYLLGNSPSSQSSFILQHNDIISVRKKEGVESLSSVLIEGAVRFPGSVVLEQRADNFESLLTKAGGLREDAYLKGSYVIRENRVLAVDLSKNKIFKENFFQDGDQLNIVSETGSVEVLGGVQNEAIFVWKKGLRARHYLRNSGGKIKKEGGDAYLIQRNGLSKQISLFSNPLVMPDSRILVNRNPPKDKSDKSFIDSFTQILSVTTGALTTLLLIQRINN